jgi:probable metal-binding protein
VPTSVHGHEIIKLVHEADPPLTSAELPQRIAERFGDDVEFHACAGGGMSLDEILVFLSERGKVVEVDGKLTTDIGLMCDHE